MKLGFQPADVRHLLASHVHLDHTGAAWRWAKEFGTKIYAHPKGVASSCRSLPNWWKRGQDLWGQNGIFCGVRPGRFLRSCDSPSKIPAELRFGTQQFRVLYTPGHAQHHNAYWLESERTLSSPAMSQAFSFAGRPPMPPFPPPDIHLESWQDSLGKIRASEPASIHITHFGKSMIPFHSRRSGKTAVQLGGLDESSVYSRANRKKRSS